MGPSGSGKTTLMNIIGCLDSPSNGTYMLNNRSVSHLSENELAKIRNDEIGFVFQSFHLLARNSALENVMLPLKYAGADKKTAIAKSKESLDKLGLSDRHDHSPAELSGGQQQRVAIARALVNQPSILFADEPTGNLDKKSSNSITDLIFSLNELIQTTLVLVTHDLSLAEKCDEVYELSEGQLL